MSRWGRAALATLLIGCGVGGRASVVSPCTLAITAERRCEVREGALFCAGVSGVGWPYPEDATVSARRRVAERRVALRGEVVAVTLGERHGCALLADGGVQCWGDNSLGQLGSGVCDAGALAPRAVALPAGAKTLASLGGRTCALLEDDTAVCWGGVDHLPGARWPCRPRRVRDAEGRPLGALAQVEVDAATDQEGRLWVWGSDFFGQVSRSAPSARRAPGFEAARVAELRDVRAVASTGTGTCVIDARRRVQCWGLPVGSAERSAAAGVPRPRVLSDVHGAVALSCDVTGCCVVEGEGLRCWGARELRVPLRAAEVDDALEVRLGEGRVCVRGARLGERCEAR